MSKLEIWSMFWGFMFFGSIFFDTTDAFKYFSVGSSIIYGALDLAVKELKECNI